MAKSAVFLTMASLVEKGFVSDDQLMVEALEAAGWEISQQPWREPCDWDAYDLAVIRTPWDHQDAPEQFLKVLEQIEFSSAQLYNPLELVRWNIDKRYLQSLAEQGIPIVPTLWGQHPDQLDDLENYFDHFRVETLIVKPCISANADCTYRLHDDSWGDQLAELKKQFARRPYMIQPFMERVLTEGEYSLFYFGGEYSHAIRKVPKAEDFRVQEEHGGLILGIEAEDVWIAWGETVLGAMPEEALYARVDFLRDEAEQLYLMELELIEPSLYFRTYEGAAGNFVRAMEALS